MIKLYTIIAIKKVITQTPALNFKNIVIVLAISMPITNDSDKKLIFKKILYIYYLFQFYKNKIRALFNNKNKVNNMSSNYTQKLSLKI